MNRCYYVIFDSLGGYVKAFVDYVSAESFWIARGGAMSNWEIKQRISKY